MHRPLWKTETRHFRGLLTMIFWKDKVASVSTVFHFQTSERLKPTLLHSIHPSCVQKYRTNKRDCFGPSVRCRTPPPETALSAALYLSEALEMEDQDVGERP